MPITTCAVLECGSTAWTTNLHQWPRNDAVGEIWLTILTPYNPHLASLPRKTLAKQMVCRLHFEQRNYTGNKRKNISWPTLFSPDEIVTGVPTFPITVDTFKSDHTYGIETPGNIARSSEQRTISEKEGEAIALNLINVNQDHSYGKNPQKKFKLLLSNREGNTIDKIPTDVSGTSYKTTPGSSKRIPTAGYSIREANPSKSYPPTLKQEPIQYVAKLVKPTTQSGQNVQDIQINAPSGYINLDQNVQAFQIEPSVYKKLPKPELVTLSDQSEQLEVLYDALAPSYSQQVTTEDVNQDLILDDNIEVYNDTFVINDLPGSSTAESNEPPVDEGPFSWQKTSSAVAVPCDTEDIVQTERILTDDNTDVFMYDDGAPAKGVTSQGTVIVRDNSPERFDEDYRCNLCHDAIPGFRYTCVQCADFDLCGACDGKGDHAQHYVLRVPRGRPYSEVQSVLAKIRQSLCDSIEQLEDEMKAEVKEEPDVIEDPIFVEPVGGSDDDQQSMVSENHPEITDTEHELDSQGKSDSEDGDTDDSWVPSDNESTASFHVKRSPRKATNEPTILRPVISKSSEVVKLSIGQKFPPTFAIPSTDPAKKKSQQENTDPVVRLARSLHTQMLQKRRLDPQPSSSKVRVLSGKLGSPVTTKNLYYLDLRQRKIVTVPSDITSGQIVELPKGLRLVHPSVISKSVSVKKNQEIVVSKSVSGGKDQETAAAAVPPGHKIVKIKLKDLIKAHVNIVRLSEQEIDAATASKHSFQDCSD